MEQAINSPGDQPISSNNPPTIIVIDCGIVIVATAKTPRTVELSRGRKKQSERLFKTHNTGQSISFYCF